MMKLSCKDINLDSTCPFEARGETASEVAKKMLSHVKKDHADDMKGMTDNEMLKMFEEKAHM